MLSKIFRLTKDKDIQRLFKKGRRSFGSGINLVLRPNGLDRSRFAFVVGTKVDKRAVVRNQIKRRMREIVRLRIDLVRPGFDAALVADKKVLSADFDSMTAMIIRLMEKSGLLRR